MGRKIHSESIVAQCIEIVVNSDKIILNKGNYSLEGKDGIDFHEVEQKRFFREDCTLHSLGNRSLWKLWNGTGPKQNNNLGMERSEEGADWLPDSSQPL